VCVCVCLCDGNVQSNVAIGTTGIVAISHVVILRSLMVSFLRFFSLLFVQSHRIGQTKRVTVYKLVAKDTVDSDIYKMQEKKTKMNAAIMESHIITLDKKAKKELTEASIHRFINNSVKNEHPEEKEVIIVI
jgi:hypothetical protein